MREARRATPSTGRHEAPLVRGAHERAPVVPRHAASSMRPVAPTPVLAALAVVLVAVVSVPVVRGGAAEAARAIGLPLPATVAAVASDDASVPTADERSDDAGSADGSHAGTPRPGELGEPVVVTTSSTGAVTASGLGAPRDAGAAFTPWFPPVDDEGAPTTGAPSSSAPVEVPPVPVAWTPEPTPSPSPSDRSTTGPSPTPFPSTEPTPGLTTTPAPWTSSPAPWTPTPSPSSPTTPGATALRFSPPALVDPQVLAFPEGSSRITLDLDTDYILTLPRDRPLVNTLGLTIVGGRNVVIIGGTVDVRDGDAGVRRGMYLKDATPHGTTYVEGVRFLSSTAGALTEGIDIASPGAKVVLQNIAITGALTGSYATNHADVVQAWAGPRVLLVDGLSASSRYQGFFLLPNQYSSAPVDDWSLNRIAITGVQSAYLAWRDSGSYAIRTSDFYVTGSRYSDGGLWPASSAWPAVVAGPPPTAYAASAGFDYSSPGYL